MFLYRAQPNRIYSIKRIKVFEQNLFQGKYIEKILARKLQKWF